MTRQFAQTLLVLQFIALLVGTQMPNAWRVTAVAGLHADSSISHWAHFGLFAGMVLLAYARPLAWPLWRVMGLALCLALATEGLQFFAVDRHPRWIDVGIDLAGMLAALALVAVARFARHSWLLRRQARELQQC